jgi:hypothetical protein
MLSRLSVAAAVATVTGVEGMVATFETERVLRGEPGQSFTVNATQFSLGQRTCDIYPVEGDMPAFREGQRLLVFLYPDEFGVAQYRLANWSHGALGLRGEWVSNGLPALDDVRDLLASGVGTEPPHRMRTESRTASSTPTSSARCPATRWMMSMSRWSRRLPSHPTMAPAREPGGPAAGR